MFKESFPILYFQDMDNALDFYCNLLGFSRVYQWPDSGTPQFAYLKVGDTGIGISTYDAAKKHLKKDLDLTGSANFHRNFEVCLYVEDIETVVDKLIRNGVKQITELETKPWGERMAYFEDCEGNYLHITSRV